MHVQQVQVFFSPNEPQEVHWTQEQEPFFEAASTHPYMDRNKARIKPFFEA